MRRSITALSVVVVLAVITTSSAAAAEVEAPQLLRVEVLDSHPHDVDAYTQGLEFHDGLLYEGTGRYGVSEMRHVQPDTGEVVHRVALPATAFGEGITIVGDRIWQLTYREGIAFLRDRSTLEEISQAQYTGQGWGLCHDGTSGRLVMSDGTDQLTFRDPETFESTGTVSVTRDGLAVRSINELECVDGMVWANIWRTDQIVRIDPATGVVDAVVDAAGLLTEAERVGVAELNGIAAVDCDGTYVITGKLWPKTFTVKFVPSTG